ncbi:formate/nitrite transporter family protein [Rhodocista pekingensis]|uniref:Formate/nitrite transporter family protein n=1 Tax=Rhodocista pekingensis TaxID=201185 RepID=A0ABW2L274_9PROT
MTDQDAPFRRTLYSDDHAVPEPEPSPRLRQTEKKDVRRMSAPRAAVIHEAIRKEGEEQLGRPTSALVWSALAAGLSMGFSMVGLGAMRAGMPDGAEWAGLVASFGYAFGFLIVILGRQQLFTENTLTVMLPLLHHRSWRALRAMLRLWGIVFAFNVVGTLAFAFVAHRTAIFEPPLKEAFVDLGTHVAGFPWWTTFGKAVVAGWLIALLVWLQPLSGVARPFVIILITYLIALLDLAHIIAGSVEVSYAAFAGAIPWSEAMLGFMAPTLLGNVAGGVGLVALIHHAQIRAEMYED